MKLVATKRSDDWSVCLRSQPGRWGRGNSLQMAIGDFMLTHGADLGVSIKTNDLTKAKKKVN